MHVQLKDSLVHLQDLIHTFAYIIACICDWLWENLPLTHKDKYLEIRNSIIQNVIS